MFILRPCVHFLQDALGNEEDVVAGVILFSDQTNLSLKGSQNAWPLVMSLANIALKHRWDRHGHHLLALLPDVHGDSRYSGHERCRIFNEALSIVLEPLKLASHR